MKRLLAVLVALAGALVAPVRAQKNAKSPNRNAWVALNWDGYAAAVSYEVDRATNPSGPFVAIVTGVTKTSYNDHTAQPATTYYYVVYGFDASGTKSAPTNVASVTLQ